MTVDVGHDWQTTVDTVRHTCTREADFPMTELLMRASRHLKSKLPAHEATWDEELALSDEYDRQRGFNRPLSERAAAARASSVGAPVQRWTPPSSSF